MATELTVGSVLVSTWGYDQTNASFFKVEKIAGPWVTVRQLETVNDWRGNSMTGHAIAGENFKVNEKPARRKLRQNYQGEPMLKMESWGMFATLWNGKPVGVSCYA